MQIFYEIGERKGSMNKKLFEESLRGILNMLCELSMKLKDAVVAAANENILRGELVKLSKYADQIILYIMRVAPADLMDEYPSPYLDHSPSRSPNSSSKNYKNYSPLTTPAASRPNPCLKRVTPQL